MLLVEDLLVWMLKNEMLSENVLSIFHSFFVHETGNIENEKRVDFFKTVVKLIPDSFQARRGLAESLMEERRFKEAACQWEYIINEIGAESIQVFSRLFTCYIGMESLDEANVICGKMVQISPGNELTVSARDIYLSDFNARYEIKLYIEKRYDIEIPKWLLRLEGNYWLKCKDVAKIIVPRNDNSSIPFIDVIFKCKNIRLYPLILDDKFVFQIQYFPNVSRIIVNYNGEKFFVNVDSNRSGGVVEGKNGWLFLDNDSNQSVAQFIGERTIELKKINEWREYLNRINQMPNTVLLITPSKECVLPQYYPYEMSAQRSIDQLKEIITETMVKNFIYPIDVLKEDIRYYSKTDTHFNYVGAKVVFLELARRYFDFDPSDYLQGKFGDFNIGKRVGDLGAKFSPIREDDFFYLNKTYREEYIVYDNGKTNTGKIEYYRNNDDAISNKKILVFGGSSADVMSPYIYTCFKETLLCRTSGTIIEKVLDLFKPDYLLCQINERFIIESPKYIMKSEEEKYPIELDKNVFE